MEALKLDEVLRLINYHIDSPATAYRCARVSRAWSEHALSLLWRGSLHNGRWRTPTLAEIKSSGIPSKRLQIYMSYARFAHLEVGDSPIRDVKTTTQLLATGNLTAPHATFLSVDLTSKCMSEMTMCPLLVPTLRSVKLFGGYYTNNFLLELKSRCPLLQSLLMDNRSELMTPDGFVNFLRSIDQLRALTLVQGEMPISEDMVLHLLSKDNLEHLGLGEMACISLNTLDKLPNPGIPPAASTLRSLTLYNAEGPALQHLLPMLKNLQRVDVGLYKPLDRPSRDVLVPLSQCPRLREVVLRVANVATLSIDSLIDLVTCCQQLVKVEIAPRDVSMPVGMSLPDGAWEKLVKHMNKIEVFTLGFEVRISMAQFALLAVHCPLLRRLELYARLQMSEIRTIGSQGVFKTLEELAVMSATSFERFRTPMAIEGAAQRTANVLQEYMPLLGRFRQVEVPGNDDRDNVGHHLISKIISSRRGLQQAKRTESVQIEMEKELISRSGVPEIHMHDV